MRHLTFKPTCSRDRLVSLSTEVFDDVARSRPTFALLPHLESMAFVVTHEQDRHYLPHAATIFHEGLRSLTVSVQGTPIDTHDVGLKILLRDISTRSMNLKVLHLHVGQSFASGNAHSSGIGRLLEAIRGLEILHLCDEATPELFTCLSNLPRLRTLNFGLSCLYKDGPSVELPRTTVHPSPRRDTTAFASLNRLSFHASSSTRLLRVFETNLTIRHISELFISIGPYTLVELRGIFAKLQNMLGDASKLHRLSIYLQPYGGVSSPRVHSELLFSICKYASITSLRIKAQIPISMSDLDFERFASALPNIETLSITWAYTHPPERAATLETLIPLVRACPRLLELEMYIDASDSGVPSLEALPTTVTPFLKLESLCFSSSPIQESSIHKVAAFLSHMLLDERVLRIDSINYGARDFELRISRNGLWSQVKGMLAALMQVQNHHRDAMRKMQIENLELMARVRELESSACGSRLHGVKTSD